MRLNTIVVGITMTLLLALPAAASDYTLGVFGNANEDDTINMQDVTYTELIILEYRDRTELSDAKYDNKINMQDVTQIELVMLGKEKELTLLDTANRIVTIPRPIERVVSIQPDVTRVMIALGECDKLVGVDSYSKTCICYNSAETAPICTDEVCGGRLWELPEVGQYFSYANPELIVSLKPDVILSYGAGSNYIGMADTLQEQTGVPVVCPYGGAGTKFEEVYETIRCVGIVARRGEEADDLISFCEEKIDKLEDITSEIPDDEKPVVYFSSRGYSGSMGGFTRTTNQYYPLDIAGGINVARDVLPEKSGSTAVDVSKEQIIAWDPDIIIIAHSFGKSLDEMNDVERVLTDPDLQSMKAVKNGDVYFTLYPYCLGTPHDRNLAAAFYLAKLFHPEEFEDLDVEEEGNEIYERFLRVDGLFSEYADATVWLREWLDAQ